MDAGYKTPGIAHLLFQNNLTPIFPYKRPMTKKDFIKNMIMFMMNTTINISALI